MTQALEVIRLRSFPPGSQEAEKQLLKLFPALLGSGARLYRNAAIPNDLSIHLTSRLKEPQASDAKTLALRIADALQEFGQVHHSRWVELDAGSSNTPGGGRDA